LNRTVRTNKARDVLFVRTIRFQPRASLRDARRTFRRDTQPPDLL